MKTIEITDPGIEDLLVICKRDRKHLETLLGQYATMCATSNQQMIAHYSDQIIKVCRLWGTDNQEVIAISLLCEAMANYYHAKFQNVINPCKEALEILEASRYEDLIGLGHFILGAANRSLGELDIAVKYLIKGTECISRQGALSIYHCYCFYQLAEINIQIKDFPTAERHYNKVINVARELGNSSVLFRAYNGMANLQLSIKNNDKCKDYLDLAMAVKGLSNAEKGRGYCDFGIYYHENGEYEKAIETLSKSYDIRIKSGLYDAASTSLLNLGKTQLACNNDNDALKSLVEALKICLRYQSKSKLLLCYELMAETYAKLEEWEKSVNSFKHYKELMNEVANRQLQNIYKIKNNQINKQKEIIEETHQEITDSIRYAKRLQDAILPSFAEVNKYLLNNFIYFKPKDLVSGDFYWFEHINGSDYLAAADCTGHGVPGAMVSIVCSNALNRSVKEFGITEPSEILNKTRELVIETFAKSSEEVKDGMDIALCKFKGNTLSYAGANNPLWIIPEGANSIELILEYKADKQPIGNYAVEKPFTTHTVTINKGDTIYIFSDGYADQFGGEKGKKFKARALKSLLIGVHDKPMEVQKQILHQTFEDWKGKSDQIDDVCVIGVKI